MKKCSSLLIPAVLGFFGLFTIAAPCYGIESSWTGGIDEVWSKSGNWSNGVRGETGVNSQNADIAIFRSAGGTAAISLTDSSRNRGGIRFNEEADEASRLRWKATSGSLVIL